MERRIIEIDEALCNGCGICADACHESAIQMVEGKAKLVSDQYCDGIGDCLPTCPTDAIKMIEREADAYSQEAVDKRLKLLGKAPLEEEHFKVHTGHHGGCPGSMNKVIKPKAEQASTNNDFSGSDYNQVMSQLTTWPVQLNLVNPNAHYLKDANILIAADCTAFAYGDFHKAFIKDHVTLIGCPKLDDAHYYTEKLTQIFTDNTPKSITVVRMEVPCCSGIINAVKQAMLQSEMIVPYKEVTITLDGQKK